MSVEADLNELKQSIHQLNSRLDTLERATPKRHTHSTTAGLEDALAVAVDIIKSEEVQNQYTRGRLRQMVQVIQEVREGPYAYDPDRNAGRRCIGDGQANPV